MRIETGEPVIYEYTHTNGNSYWQRKKEGIFLMELEKGMVVVYLLGSKTAKKVPGNEIKRKDKVFDLKYEYELLTDPIRVGANRIFSWKQVKELLKFASEGEGEE